MRLRTFRAAALAAAIALPSTLPQAAFARGARVFYSRREC